MLEIAAASAAATDLAKTLQTIADQAALVLDAEWATVFLHDPDTDEFYVQAGAPGGASPARALARQRRLRLAASNAPRPASSRPTPMGVMAGTGVDGVKPCGPRAGRHVPVADRAVLQTAGVPLEADHLAVVAFDDRRQDRVRRAVAGLAVDTAMSAGVAEQRPGSAEYSGPWQVPQSGSSSHGRRPSSIERDHLVQVTVAVHADETDQVVNAAQALGDHAGMALVAGGPLFCVLAVHGERQARDARQARHAEGGVGVAVRAQHGLAADQVGAVLLVVAIEDRHLDPLGPWWQSSQCISTDTGTTMVVASQQRPARVAQLQVAELEGRPRCSSPGPRRA